LIKDKRQKYKDKRQKYKDKRQKTKDKRQKVKGKSKKAKGKSKKAKVKVTPNGERQLMTCSAQITAAGQITATSGAK